MKIKIIIIGKIKESWIRDGIKEYLKRMSFTKIEILSLKNRTVEKEAEDILSRIKDEFVVVLSEEGKQASSVEFSQLLKNTQKDIVFVIGSADGLSERVKQKADLLLSLSMMTFTHELAQLLLVEQIYRGFTILKNKKYHRS